MFKILSGLIMAVITFTCHSQGLITNDALGISLTIILFTVADGFDDILKK